MFLATCRIALWDTLAKTAFLNSENKVEKILARASMTDQGALRTMSEAHRCKTQPSLTSCNCGTPDDPNGSIRSYFHVQSVDNVLEEKWDLYVENLVKSVGRD